MGCLQDIYKIIQSLGVSIKPTHIIGFLAACLFFGCQEDPSARAPQASAEIELPSAFDESLELAFQANPEQTAKRILRAHDGFSRVGPVTTQSVKDYMRLERSADRARIVTDILAIDLNGDQMITRAEFDVLPTLPNGYKKAARLSGLFEHDKNNDTYISLSEALIFAEQLNTARFKNDIHPIGSYLMLFDLDADGRVMRAEVTLALRDYLKDIQKPNTALRGKQVLR